jgi:hypothetical protein
MTTTTDLHDDTSSDSTTEAAVATTDTSEYMAGDDHSGSASRLARVNWLRFVGFLVLIPVWALSAVPLARELIDGRDGARVILTYLAVAGISLGIVAVIRGIYARLMERRFWSPWMFLVAAVLALAGHSVQTAGMEEPEIPPVGVVLHLS